MRTKHNCEVSVVLLESLVHTSDGSGDGDGSRDGRILTFSVNHENGDGSTSGCSTEAAMEGTNRSFFFRRLFCFR